LVGFSYVPVLTYTPLIPDELSAEDI